LLYIFSNNGMFLIGMDLSVYYYIPSDHRARRAIISTSFCFNQIATIHVKGWRIPGKAEVRPILAFVVVPRS
jgi:hypothetical protein